MVPGLYASYRIDPTQIVKDDESTLGPYLAHVESISCFVEAQDAWLL